jgi:hypothetical protein
VSTGCVRPRRHHWCTCPQDEISRDIASRIGDPHARHVLGASSVLEAEEAIGDPLKMIPLLLDHAAIEGEVVAADWHNTEIKGGNKIQSAVPLITIRTA